MNPDPDFVTEQFATASGQKAGMTPEDERPIVASGTEHAVEPSATQSPELSDEGFLQFVVGDVHCTLRLVGRDYRRKLALYDVLVENKRAVKVSCRLYGLNRAQRTNDMAIFEVPEHSLGRSRFFVPLGRSSIRGRFYLQVLGEGIALRIETQLPSPEDSGRPRAAGVATGFAGAACIVAALLFYIVAHDRSGSSPARAVAPPPLHAMAQPRARVSRPAAPSVIVASARFHAIDDASSNGFVYTGAWQHIKNLYDGRSEGTSSRSYHIGDTAHLAFRGARFKLIGIEGPNGGSAELAIDGEPRALLRFYAPAKTIGVEMYVSPAMAVVTHTVDVVIVSSAGENLKQRYVNIDGAAYAER